LIKQNEAACVGLICLAIKDAGMDSKTMSYKDYEDLFRTHLPMRLEKMKISNSNELTKELLTFLNQKQSLFTMMAH
jgi:hypothetical protein